MNTKNDAKNYSANDVKQDNNNRSTVETSTIDGYTSDRLTNRGSGKNSENNVSAKNVKTTCRGSDNTTGSGKNCGKGCGKG